jgi:hypothetical protein
LSKAFRPEREEDHQVFEFLRVPQDPKEEKSRRLFEFLPNLIRSAMKADTDAASKNSFEFFLSSKHASRISSDLSAFGKNEQMRKVFWSVFIALAGLVLAQVVDPVTTQTILVAITGAGA